VVPRFRAICTKRRGRGFPSGPTFAFNCTPLDTVRSANSRRYSPPGFTSWGINSPAPSLRRWPVKQLQLIGPWEPARLAIALFTSASFRCTTKAEHCRAMIPRSRRSSGFTSLTYPVANARCFWGDVEIVHLRVRKRPTSEARLEQSLRGWSL
jgi:hypothetical protein